MTRSSVLDRRYGRTVGRRRRNLVIAASAAVGVVLVVSAWVLWAGFLSPSASIEVRDLGYDNRTDEQVTVTWELTSPAGSDASCAVQALDGNFAIVGWKVVDIPASDDRTRRFEQQLRTSAPPVTGLIYRCWLN